MAQIARAWWLTRQSVQRVADVLVRDGLATYEANPNHRRAKLLRITPAGLSALHEIRLRQRAWAESLGAQIGSRNCARRTPPDTDAGDVDDPLIQELRKVRRFVAGVQSSGGALRRRPRSRRV